MITEIAKHLNKGDFLLDGRDTEGGRLDIS